MFRQRRLRWGAVLVGILILSYFCYWTYDWTAHLVEFYGDSHRWLDLEYVDAIKIGWLPWLLALGFDCSAYLISGWLFITSMVLVSKIYRIQLFTQSFYRTLISLGLGLVILGVWDSFYWVLMSGLLTLPNEAGPEFEAWVFYAPHVTIGVMGALISLFGLVMNEARLIEEENRAFV